MTRLALKICIVVIAFTGYVAAPLVTAWSVREAVRNADSAYLERAIDWPKVRVSLAPSLSRIALNIPETTTAETVANTGWWQRLKTYFGRSAVSSAVDAYLTPEGLPKLYAMGQTYRSYVQNLPDDAKLSLMERAKRAWGRIKRAEFLSPTVFEVDMVTKHDPSRMVHARLDLRSNGWIVTGLRLSNVTADQSGKTSDEQMLPAAPSKPLLLMPHNRSPEQVAETATPISTPQPSTWRRSAWSTFFIKAAEAAQPRVGQER